MRVNLEDFKLTYVLSCVLLGLIILSPTLAMVVKLPGGEPFSELWILGPDQMAKDYPFNVKPNEIYKIFLGIGNHMGCSEYYLVYVKFRNQSEPIPDSVNGKPSHLMPIFELRFVLGDNQTLKEIVFSFREVAFDGNLSRVSRVIINGYELSVDKVALWDEENRGFYFQLFFELWLYKSTTSDFQFHNRFVSLWLNMTSSL
jgi:uncharacterized membrane protein